MARMKKAIRRACRYGSACAARPVPLTAQDFHPALNQAETCEFPELLLAFSR
jgi:hypothetical protein